MRLSDLLKNVTYVKVQGDTECEISSLAYDSRKVTEGAAFVCISGAKSDGHSHVMEAAGKGAAAIIAERMVEVPKGVTLVIAGNTRAALAQMSAAWFGSPGAELSSVAITGTKGKTTTAYMVKAILEAAGHTCGLIGTIETVIGEEHIPSNNTTPESYVIQETFRKMADAGCDCMVMEVSSQALMMHRTDGILFDYGIFTNLEPDHIGENEHKDLDDYIHCKSLLFRQCRTGIVNIDDTHLGKVLLGHTCSIETYGFYQHAMLSAKDVHLYKGNGTLGVRYHLCGALDMDVATDIPGTFSVYNSMAAIAACIHFSGVTGEVIRQALSTVHVRGRVEMVPVSDKFTVLVDYAHNAMSLQSLLTTLRDYNPGRLVCLFGCGGNRSKERRFEMGEVSSRLADLTIVTSDNPRDEDPEDIINDILSGMGSKGAVLAITDRAEAVKYAIGNAKEGDMVIIAGKGHEDYQEIHGVKHHMDDRELVAEAAKAAGYVE